MLIDNSSRNQEEKKEVLRRISRVTRKFRVFFFRFLQFPNNLLKWTDDCLPLRHRYAVREVERSPSQVILYRLSNNAEKREENLYNYFRKTMSIKQTLFSCFSDPYVKIYLICGNKRIRKKRTSVKRRTLNPVYNEALTFDVPSTNVEEVSLIVKVIDYDR